MRSVSVSVIILCRTRKNVLCANTTISPKIPRIGENNTTNFGFNATDGLSSNFSCRLYLNATAYGTNSTVLNNTPTNITSSQIPDGSYSWYINCSDLAGNIGLSAARNITIITDSLNVTLHNPLNGTYSKNTSYNFNWTAENAVDFVLDAV